MRLRHWLDLFCRPILLVCSVGLFGSLIACGAIPTISEPTPLPLATDTPESIATLSLPTFTVVLPTATFSKPTNTIPVPTLTSEASETPEITKTPEATATSQVTATNEVMATSEVTAINEVTPTSEVTSTVPPVEEATPTMVGPTATVGTPTPTIVLATFTPDPADTSQPFPTVTVTGNNPTRTPRPTETPFEATPDATATDIPFETTPDATATDIPFETTPDATATDIPFEATPDATATDIPFEATPDATATDIPLEATPDVMVTETPLEVTPDTPTPEPNETGSSSFFATLPLDSFTALPQLDALDYNQINPAQAVQYWELRLAFPDQTAEVIGSAGTREGIDGALLEQFDLVMVDSGFDVGCLPAYCFKYVVSISNNQIQTWQTVEELNSFLGPIDRPEEAILLVMAHEYNWSNEAGKETGSYRAVADGYEFIVTKLVNDCDPVQTDRYLLHVSTSGTVTIQQSEIWTQHLGMCI